MMRNKKRDGSTDDRHCLRRMFGPPDEIQAADNGILAHIYRREGLRALFVPNGQQECESGGFFDLETGLPVGARMAEKLLALSRCPRRKIAEPKANHDDLAKVLSVCGPPDETETIEQPRPITTLVYRHEGIRMVFARNPSGIWELAGYADMVTRLPIGARSAVKSLIASGRLGPGSTF
jgi:hypothetical protein